MFETKYFYSDQDYIHEEVQQMLDEIGKEKKFFSFRTFMKVLAVDSLLHSL